MCVRCIAVPVAWYSRPRLSRLARESRPGRWETGTPKVKNRLEWGFYLFVSTHFLFSLPDFWREAPRSHGLDHAHFRCPVHIWWSQWLPLHLLPVSAYLLGHFSVHIALCIPDGLVCQQGSVQPPEWWLCGSMHASVGAKGNLAAFGVT